MGLNKLNELNTVLSYICADIFYIKNIRKVKNVIRKVNKTFKKR